MERKTGKKKKGASSRGRDGRIKIHVGVKDAELTVQMANGSRETFVVNTTLRDLALVLATEAAKQDVLKAAWIFRSVGSVMVTVREKTAARGKARRGGL